VQLCELVATSAQVAASSGRKAKITAIAELLARVPPDEVPIAVAFLSGDLTQRQIGVGYAALMDLSPPDRPAQGLGQGQGQPEPHDAVLTLRETDDTFEAIGAMLGPGSQAQRRAALAGLIGRATETERQFLFRLIAGELHQGALEGVMIEAVALAAGAPASEVRRANQLRGSLPQVARAALAAAAATEDGTGPGKDGTGPGKVVEVLRAFTLTVGQPIKPMLAASAPNVEAALGKISPAALDWKIDGIRIQIHRQGQQVQIFTRTLDDITGRLPEIVTIALGLDVESAVIDAEAIALRPDGRPHPFQITSARAASQLVDGQPADGVPLTAFMFDLLHLNGADLIDEPATDRFEELAAIVPPELLIPRIVTADPDEAAAFFADAVAKGHEGLVVKSTNAPYQTGRRGSDWIKVKPRTTLDLVILAAEWGHGRRTGLLSNLHLGARDPDTGKFVMLGKTFKGLTDAMLRWQTDHLLELADPPDQPDVTRPYGVVRVRPELVAEIAFDGVQASKRYPGGVTLRFARVLRYRDDKQAAEADTIAMVQALWNQAPGDQTPGDQTPGDQGPEDPGS
jgi:ATP-dependent DNA ligase I